MKYKQSVIPKVDEKQFDGLRLGELKTYVTEYFDKHIKDSKIKNLHKGVSIEIRK